MGCFHLFLNCGFIVLISQSIASPLYYWRINRITSKSLHNHKWTIYSCKLICHWGHWMALIKHLITLRTQTVSGNFLLLSHFYSLQAIFFTVILSPACLWKQHNWSDFRHKLELTTELWRMWRTTGECKQSHPSCIVPHYDVFVRSARRLLPCEICFNIANVERHNDGTRLS